MNTLRKAILLTAMMGVPLSGLATEGTKNVTPKSTGYYNLNAGDYTKPQKSGDLPTEGPGKISVSNHGVFSITLPANPTTGYSWGLTTLPDTLMLLDTDYRQSEDCNGMLGCGGYRTYTFKAINRGQGTLRFQYGRQWENAGFNTRVVDVTVK